MLEVGVVVQVDASGRLGGTIATLGRVERVEAEDALLVAATRSREIVYLPSKGSWRDPRLWSRLLAALPFIDTAGVLHAVLCVQSMPFTAFHKKNLETLAILAGHFADLVATRGESFDVDRARQVAFETRLARALHDRRLFGVPSVVAGLWMQGTGAIAAVAEMVLAGFLRPVDAPLHKRDRFGNVLVLVLLPMAGVTDARAVQARVEAIVRRELDASLADAGAVMSFCVVEPHDTVAGVLDRVTHQVQPP
jgi:hypothetical protein